VLRVSCEIFLCVSARLLFHCSVLHLFISTMDASPTDLFSVFEYNETKVATETLKWALGANGATKHENFTYPV
jgi:hypothetical protein